MKSKESFRDFLKVDKAPGVDNSAVNILEHEHEKVELMFYYVTIA